MNSYMNITVRVMAAQAQAQMRDMAKQIADLETQLAKANRTGSGGFGAGNMGQALTRLGSQIQWTGRQLSTNFTVPIVAAGTAAATFALKSEASMVKIQKVYGDTSMSTQQVANETAALGKTFETLSNTFGVAYADTLDIAAGWAAAGASGVALAKATKLTMETMILGEVDATTATQALIAIQAQYGQSVEELATTIDTLNMVENQTGISMAGLIDGMSRAAGTARSAGVDVQHLAAFMAALVPSAGTAANAGNALKTIFSRLLSPTQEANQVLGLMGVNTADLGWKSLNAAQRLETLAKAFNGLDDAQKEVVSTVIASRYQINKFDVLMRDITNANGYYQKALNATADANANQAQRVRELNTVLDSNPRKLQIMYTILQNAMMDIIQPLIPLIVYLASVVATLAQRFSELPPGVQKFTLLVLGLLAAIGPVAMYLGSTMTLLGLLGRALGLVLGPLAAFGGVFTASFAGPAAFISKVWGALWPRLAASTKTGLYRMTFDTQRSMAATEEAVVMASGATKATWTEAMAVFAGSTSAAMGDTNRVFVAGMEANTTVVATAPIVPAWLATMTNMDLATKAGMGDVVATMGTGLTLIQDIWGTWWIGFAGAMGTGWIAIEDIWTVAWWELRGITAGGLLAIEAAVGTALTTMSVTFFTGTTVIEDIWDVMWWHLAAISAGGMLAIEGTMAAGMASATAITGAGMLAIEGTVVTGGLAIPAALAAVGAAIVTAITNPWVIAAGAVVVLLLIFQDQVKEIFWASVDFVVGAFNRMPAAVQAPIMAVVNFIKQAALAVYGWFSYLNPFAHHSPSLVEQVTAGMALIKKQYASVGNVGAIFGKAVTDLQKFKAAVSNLGIDEFTSQRKDVAEFFPGLLGQFNQIVKNIKDLKAVLSTVEGAMDAQQAITDRYKKTLDDANDSLDAQQKLLDKAKDNLQSLTDAYEAHQQAVQDYANTGITGMKAMDDAIFENGQAQKELQLQILKLQDSGAQSVDELSDAYKRLQGDIENINGVVGDLRNKGAGSEITDPLLEQANSMRASAGEMQKQIANNPIGNLQAQLDKLNRQGQIMDLEKSLKFDSLTRQIQEAANATKEMSFEDIISGIGREKQAMQDLQPQIDAAKQAVQGHEKAVADLTATRDAAQASYDIENKKLTELKDAYQSVNDVIRDQEQALSDLASAAQAQRDAQSNDYLTPGAQNFINAEGGNFPDVGGFAQIGREGGAEDQSAMIDQFTKDLAASTAGAFGTFDMFAPIKDAWNKTVAWLKDNVGGIGDAIGGSFKASFGQMSFAPDVEAGVTGFFDKIKDFGGYLKDLFGPEVSKTWQNIKDAAAEFWDYMAPKFAQFKELAEPLMLILTTAGQGFVTLMKIVGGALLYIAKVVWSEFNGVFMGLWQIVQGAFGLVVDIIFGVVKLIVSLMTGDFKGAGEAIVGIFVDTFTGIAEILQGATSVVLGFVSGMVTGIVDFFTWLWDVLVGHSIVPDMVNAIIQWFQNMWTWAVEKVVGMKNAVVQWFMQMVTDALVWITELVVKVVLGAQNMWDGFLAKSKEIWVTIATWLLGLGVDAYTKLQDLVNKVKQIGSDAFGGLKSIVQDIWENQLKPIFEAFRSFLVDTVAPKVSDAIASIGNAWTALKEAAADPIRFIVDTVYNNGLRKFFNTITGMIGGPTLPEIKLAFAEGGVVPGGYSPGKDTTLAAVGAGEAIMRPEFTRAVGSGFINQMNALAKSGGVSAVAKAMSMPQYADGGIMAGLGSLVGSIGSAGKKIGGNLVEKVSDTVAKVSNTVSSAASKLLGVVMQAGQIYVPDKMSLLDVVKMNPAAAFQQLATNVVSQATSSLTGAGSTQFGDMVAQMPAFLIKTMASNLSGMGSQMFGGGGSFDGPTAVGEQSSTGGWQWQVAQIHKAFPGLAITSTFRPGAETVSGNTSWHARGRAIDVAPSMDVFNWLLNNYGKTSKEIIYSPANQRQIKNGMPYMYSGEVRDMHYNHVHWAYDQGGWLQPGAGQYVNKTGQPEAVLTASQWGDMSTIANGLKSVSAVASRLDRAVAIMEARAATTTGSATVHNEYHFHGDLAFPNVKGGEDAEDFLDNLKTLAGA